LLWIPITLLAAALQTARNAFQRGLTGALSPLGATYTRFAFGFPFAALYAAFVLARTGAPAPSLTFFAWVTLGGIAQILGTVALMQLFRLRSFSTGIAFSKSEILQVALVGIFVLGDGVTLFAALAIGVATAGLVLLSRDPGAASWREVAAGLTGPSALLGLATGAGYAVAAVSFRASSLSLGDPSFVASAATTLVAATGIQTMLMTAYLRFAEPGQIGVVFRMWRRSLMPGLTGAAASACWFTAMTIEIAAYVRMLGLVEVLFGYGVSILALRERQSPRETWGTALLVVAIAALLWDRAG
jgi:drug/metabolite transporter (DMT)-like permease